MECFDGGSPKHNQLGGLLPFFKCAKNTVRYPIAALPALSRIFAYRFSGLGDIAVRHRKGQGFPWPIIPLYFL